MTNPADNMIAVPLDSFFQGLKADVDVFIRLNDAKFVLLVRANEAFDYAQLKRYQIKNLTHLHIRKEDYSNFIKRQLVIAGIVIDHTEITNKKKTAVLTHTAENIFKEIEELGINEDTFTNAKQITTHIAHFIETQDRLGKLFESLNKISDQMIKHSISVGLFSVMIGKEMGWTRRETLEKLNLGGFLHDIGKKELDPEILVKPRDTMTRDELKDYESHPYRGMMILQSLNTIPQDIVSIVYEHHENSHGQGYPRRLKDVAIHPLAKVVGLANLFVDLTIKSPMNPKPMKSADAVSHIELVMGKPYSKETFDGLKSLIFGKQTLKDVS